MEVGFDGLRDELEDVAVLLAAGFDGGQQRFHEAAAGSALRPERELPPDHGVTERPLRRVVRRFDAVHFQERPQPVAMVTQFPAHAVRGGAEAAQQQAVDLVADRLHQTLEAPPREGPIPAARPVPEEGFGRSHQVMAQAFDLVIIAVNQRLKVSLQMSPAPLQAAALPVHFRPVAADDAGEGLAQQFAEGRGGAAAAEGEHGEAAGDEGPQPALHRAFLRRRFIAVELRLSRQRRDQFRVRWLQRARDDRLLFDRQRGAAGDVQNRRDEQRRAAFALPETGHQQRDEGDQLRTRLAARHARGKRGTRRVAAAGTAQAMLLILGDQRFDLGQFIHLMPQRCGIAARQFRAAPATLVRLERNDSVALIGGNQRPFVPGMSRLTAVILLRLRPRFQRLGMRMLRAGGQRRILRRLPQALEFRFQPGNPLLIVTHDRLDHRADIGRQGSQLLGTDRQRRHPADVAHFSIRANPNFRPRPVNGYGDPLRDSSVSPDGWDADHRRLQWYGA